MTDQIEAIDALQEQLRRARAGRDAGKEVDTLLSIGKLSLSDDPGGAHMHFRLAEKVAKKASLEDRLHEAFGGQGRVARRQGDYAGAIEKFLAAEKAAISCGQPVDAGWWTLQRAASLRDAGDTAAAAAAIQEAEACIRPKTDAPSSLLGSVNLFDSHQMLAVAELEGQIGLTAMAEGDPEAAEEAYRNAVDLAEGAESSSDVAVWATNLGNACARRRSYSEALRHYEMAIRAAKEEDDERRLAISAQQMAACYANAHRLAEGGTRLLDIADSLENLSAQFRVVELAMFLFENGVEIEKYAATARRAQELAVKLALPSEQIERLNKEVARSENALAAGRRGKKEEGPTPLELYLPRTMARAQENQDLGLAQDAAHLVCDVRLGLFLAGADDWKRVMGGDILGQVGLDVRVVTDTIEWLVAAEDTASALELLQRFKSVGFASPGLRRLADVGHEYQEAVDYVSAGRVLQTEVDRLSGPAQTTFIRDIHAVRRAGEELLERGEVLRERDPVLAARLGGLIRKEELIDALPHSDPVAIVDYVVTGNGTSGVVLMRGGNTVEAIPFMNKEFTAEHTREMLQLYVDADVPKGFGKAQSQALHKIAKILHDRFLCGLIQQLSKRGATQLILVPDVFTRFLPLHLSLICGNEIQIPGVDIDGSQYLCEVMPVEYASCLQAVAASQIYRRPKRISKVSAFTNPTGDLPATSSALKRFKRKLAKSVKCDLHIGELATVQNVEKAIEKSDVVLFGTHGVFDTAAPERSHLVLHDGNWSMTDMMAMKELVRNPILVLAACEVASAGPSVDERDAYGIPGTLVAAGAATVLANLWPVEDVLMAHLLERFLHHLSHRGYRPSAALFRAVRDIRRMDQRQALELYREQIASLKRSGADDRLIISCENLMEWIEDTDAENPFADPTFWGATVIVGSGWHLPAGASVGSGPVIVDLTIKLSQAVAQFEEGEFQAAARDAREVAGASDGLLRARALVLQAAAMSSGSAICERGKVARSASRLLLEAERTARAEEDDELIAWISQVRQDLED